MVLDRETGQEKQKRVEQNAWHCSLSLHPDEAPLSEEQWQQIADEFMERMGFNEAGDRAGARWVAVHHGASAMGNDHIHIAASMVREDGDRWVAPARFRGRDFPAAQAVCRELEVAHGLRLNDGSARGVAERGVKPQEQATAAKLGMDQSVRREIAERVRAAAVASVNEAEWVRRIRGDGMVIKPRFAQGTTDVVLGYRVALKTGDRGVPLRFIGGKNLAQDLSLPRVRECWPEPSLQEATAASAEWQAAHSNEPPVVYSGRETSKVAPQTPAIAARSLEGFAQALRDVPPTDRRAWQEAARDVSGALSAWAKYEKKIDPGNAQRLRESARVVARSAQERRPGQGRRTPRPQLPMGAAFLFLAATASDKPEIAAQFMAQQMMAAVLEIARAARAVGAQRQADVLQHQVYEQLAHVSGHDPAGGAPLASVATARPRTDQVEQMRAAGVDEESINAWVVAHRGDTPTRGDAAPRPSTPSTPRTAGRTTRQDQQKGEDHER